jgi:hypothetical protein
MEKVATVRRDTVRAQVARGNHSRWGGAESVAVIEELVSLLVSDEEVGAEGFDAIREAVTEVVNPSAFAQVLEKLDESHPAHIRRPEKGKRTSKAGEGL